jgi:hypothetical protein
MKKEKIYIVVAQYYLNQEDLDKKMEIIKSLLKNQGFTVEDITLNLNETNQYPLFDFSAYAHGVSNLDLDNSLVIFINDTFFIKHPWKFLLRKFIDNIDLLNSIPSACALGVIHDSTKLVMIDDFNLSRKHLSTFFFGLNKKGLSIFRSVIKNLPKFEDDYKEWIYSELRNNPFLEVMIHAHLIEKNSQWAWEGLKKNFDESILLKKKICVIAEYNLSRAIMSEKGCFIPMNIGLIFTIQNRFKKSFFNFKNKVFK